jgi:hypothetical protein
MAIEKLKRRKSPGIGQIPAYLVIAGGKSEIHNFINWILNKEELPEWKKLIIIPIHKKGR